MKRFVENWPLTCWTCPAMMQVFHLAGGGKTGASLAVISAHALPFMGSQTTLMQRYFLPHPLDTIVSQPFGMSEDPLVLAISMATTNPMLAAVSLTVIIAGLNLAQFAVFSKRRDWLALTTCVLNIVVGCMFCVLTQNWTSSGLRLA